MAIIQIKYLAKKSGKTYTDYYFKDIKDLDKLINKDKHEVLEVLQHKDSVEGVVYANYIMYAASKLSFMGRRYKYIDSRILEFFLDKLPILVFYKQKELDEFVKDYTSNDIYIDDYDKVGRQILDIETKDKIISNCKVFNMSKKNFLKLTK